jgi:hypothetical protein
MRGAGKSWREIASHVHAGVTTVRRIVGKKSAAKQSGGEAA